MCLILMIEEQAMIIRKATQKDIDAIEKIYSDIHTFEEEGRVVIGWNRQIYPTRKTASDAVARGDMFVMENDGCIVGTAIINKCQVDTYRDAAWEHEAEDDRVMVLHTLIISPYESGKGYGKAFVKFYEDYALRNNCPYLRMDTNEKNTNARRLYKKLGYKEVDILPCTFNGIEGVGLVCLEKYLGE